LVKAAVSFNGVIIEEEKGSERSGPFSSFTGNLAMPTAAKAATAMETSEAALSD
jgi:hypothetical protein